jgi:hypothetical protein
VRLRAQGTIFKLDMLRLTSQAPNPVTASLSPGSVADTGTGHRAGRDGVRLALSGPGMLVLGQSFSAGWRAFCDGRSLGAPRPVDGYANGWDVKPPCANVRFAFAANGPVHLLQLLSALAALLLLALAVVPRKSSARAPVADDLPEPPPRTTSLRRALTLGLLAGAVLGFCFSLRSGVAIFAGVTLISWLGIGPRLLVLTAGALLTVAVPALYLLFPAQDYGGYSPGYASDHIAPHWVGVAAFTLLAVALAQTLSTASRRRADAAGSGP